jgi:hypothetical protein
MGHALVFGDLEDPDSEVSRLVADEGVTPDRPMFPAYFSQVFKPAVYYTSSRATSQKRRK